ncbi:TPA: hypothetical protein N0F65_005302 [Lagenidium giganteum]|uniref:SPRY domain-containing protein n=1 Tax=Lagenidium giganteum TaxID=4803 RepID=A0AAV2YZ98_9STRA|nr:TPA: hypothetical protein N0F65_005302 [Lagenidium giganteum]
MVVTTCSISPRQTKLKQYLVLTKERRLSKEGPIEMDAQDENVAYESYGAVLSRYNQNAERGVTRQLRWSDLNRPRFHLGRYLKNANKTTSQKPRKRQLKRSASSTGTDVLEVQAWELCFEFLTLDEIQQATLVCSEWREIVTTSRLLLLGIYCRKWRPSMASIPSTYMDLSYPQLVTLNAKRRETMDFALSTRSGVTRHADGKYEVVNNSMLRSFARGSIDSVRGTKPLPVLSCAEALRMRVGYFEVTLKGCGSVGVVSLSDEASKTAYGFGSEEHIGWKGISFGYHGNDGDFVYNDGSAPYGGEWQPFGPSWGNVNAATDEDAAAFIVGCGVNMLSNQLFFTLNGQLVGNAPVALPEGEYTAAVALHAFGDSAILNMGTVPFAFDIEGFCASP